MQRSTCDRMAPLHSLEAIDDDDCPLLHVALVGSGGRRDRISAHRVDRQVSLAGKRRCNTEAAVAAAEEEVLPGMFPP